MCKCSKQIKIKNKMISSNLQYEMDFTQKQIPRQNEKFNLLSADEVSV